MPRTKKAAELTDSEAPEQAEPVAEPVPVCNHCHLEMRPGSTPDLWFCPSCFRVHRP